VLGETIVPQRISTSYGGFEEVVPLEFAKRVCGLYEQLGAREAGVLFTAGNFGVGKDCTDRPVNV